MSRVLDVAQIVILFLGITIGSLVIFGWVSFHLFHNEVISIFVFLTLWSFFIYSLYKFDTAEKEKAKKEALEEASRHYEQILEGLAPKQAIGLTKEQKEARKLLREFAQKD